MSKTMDRVAAILNQAENASTPEEAKTFMDKAMALAASASIDLAVARQHTRNKEAREEVEVGRRIVVNPYSRRFNRQWFISLFQGIGHVYDLRFRIDMENYWVKATGYPSDIAMTEAMFASLAIQMVSEADAALKRGENKGVTEHRIWALDESGKRVAADLDADGHPVDPDNARWGVYYPNQHDESAPDDLYWAEVTAYWVTTVESRTASTMDGRIWRQNFYKGFIARATARLWDIRREQEALATGGDESSSTAVALVDKTAAVDSAAKAEDERLLNARKELNPRARETYHKGAQVKTTDYGALKAGQAAGQRARLGGEGNEVSGGKTKQIG